MKKFKKNDQVIVISGSQKGKTGKILIIKDNAVCVEGVNMKTIHKKPTSTEQGKIIKKESFLHISNISHVLNNKSVKISYKTSKKGNDEKTFKMKYREIKKLGNKID
jgi:large subunit ribosomal protein L24